jgi:hypothetical protein
MWPAFAAFTVLDAIVGHLLPASGETQRLLGALIAAIVINLLVIVLLSRPLGALVRHVRGDLPAVVARDYAGTALVAGVATVLLIAGLIHHSTVVAHRRAMQDAIARAQAWIGDRAPAEFRRNLGYVSTVAIEPGAIYRTCVVSVDHRHTYCVIVRTQLPFQRSVSFDGYESNAVFSEGTG